MFPKEISILVVDDTGSMRMMVTNALKQLGYENVTLAKDGKEAWKKTEAASDSGKLFDLIICDWNMPEMNGIEFLKKIKDFEKTQNIPFMMLTAESEKEKLIEALKLGVDNYIVKPCSPELLGERIQAVWDKRKVAA